MQEILQKLFTEKGADWRALLSQVGFDAGQAERFLPASLSAIVERFTKGDFDLSSLLGGLDVSSLLKGFDLGQLASSAGVDEAHAESGLKALLPEVVSSLGERVGGDKGLLDSLKDGNLGDLLGGAKDLLS